MQLRYPLEQFMGREQVTRVKDLVRELELQNARLRAAGTSEGKLLLHTGWFREQDELVRNVRSCIASYKEFRDANDAFPLESQLPSADSSDPRHPDISNYGDPLEIESMQELLRGFEEEYNSLKKAEAKKDKRAEGSEQRALWVRQKKGKLRELGYKVWQRMGRRSKTRRHVKASAGHVDAARSQRDHVAYNASRKEPASGRPRTPSVGGSGGD